jgi:hypothetical protein
MQATAAGGRSTGRGPYLALAATFLLALCVAVPSTVEAAQELSWSAPAQIDSRGFQDLSCPANNLCVAVDDMGNALTSTNPAGGPSTWMLAHIDAHSPAASLMAVSCPSTTFCAAIDDSDDIITSTNPAGGAGTWQLTSLENFGDPRNLACASINLCVAVDQEGNVAASTNPMGGAGAWMTFPIGNRAPFGLLSDVACPSTTLCVAVNAWGDVLTATNPTGGTAAWTFAQADPAGGLAAIACPTTALCVALDGTAKNELFSAEPAAGASTWQVRPEMPNFAVRNLSCPSVSFCAAVGLDGVMTSTEPTGGAITWHQVDVDGEMIPAAIACPSSNLCVLVDVEGNVLTGTTRSEPLHEELPVPHQEPKVQPESPPPNTDSIGLVAAHLSTAQLVALLRQQLTPHGPAASPRSLLKHGGLVMPFKAPEAGTLSVGWYLVPKGAKLASHAKPMLVASGKLLLTAGSTAQLRIKLTAAGKRRLQHTKQIKLTAKAAFTPSRAAAVRANSTFALGSGVGTRAKQATLAPGVYVSGPQAISLNTAYVYRITVLTNKSYRGAALWFSAGDCAQRRVINLAAHQPWHGSFTTALSSIGFQLHPGVVVSAVSPPSNGPPYAHTLFHRELPLGQSATVVPASPPGPPERCQHFAGS